MNSAGILTGVGTLDPLVVAINSGGMFAPGAAGMPGTSMRIASNLALQSGAFYLVAERHDLNLRQCHRHRVARRHGAFRLCGGDGRAGASIHNPAVRRA